MKQFILSIIAIFCFYPVANADNSNAQLKLISENIKQPGSKTSLSGFGLEVYHKVGDSTRLVVNLEKSRTEKRVEKALKILQSKHEKNPKKSTQQDILKLTKILKKEREKRSQVAIVSDTIDKSFGFIFEARTLNGQTIYSNGADPTYVQKNVFEIGIRIDW